MRRKRATLGGKRIFYPFFTSSLTLILVGKNYMTIWLLTNQSCFPPIANGQRSTNPPTQLAFSNKCNEKLGEMMNFSKLGSWTALFSYCLARSSLIQQCENFSYFLKTYSILFSKIIQHLVTLFWFHGILCSIIKQNKTKRITLPQQAWLWEPCAQSQGWWQSHFRFRWSCPTSLASTRTPKLSRNCRRNDVECCPWKLYGQNRPVPPVNSPDPTRMQWVSICLLNEDWSTVRWDQAPDWAGRNRLWAIQIQNLEVKFVNLDSLPSFMHHLTGTECFDYLADRMGKSLWIVPFGPTVLTEGRRQRVAFDSRNVCSFTCPVAQSPSFHSDWQDYHD